MAEETALAEFFEMRPLLAQAELGTYFIIPLKYDEGALRLDRIARVGKPWSVDTMDLSEPVKALFHEDGTAAIGGCYEFSREDLLGALFGKEQSAGMRDFTVSEKDGKEKLPFSFQTAYLYHFHTQVAFLCLGLCYRDIRVLRWICNMGFAERYAVYHYRDESGMTHDFSLEEVLEAFLRSLGLEGFFAPHSSLLLEAYISNVAVVAQRFRSLETIRRSAFNLHLISPLDALAEDDSEEDVAYVYAVKTQALDSYRWGCCISSQTISYVMANEDMDIDGEMRAQAKDSLPLLLVALYEKYTCMRFTQLITAVNQKKMKQLRTLRRMMLEFQAYGTVDPANISRWHNVKRIYQAVIETNRIQEAVGDISHKLDILIEHQKEIERTRNDMVAGVITMFGLISILASVLTIIQILSDGSQAVWLALISSILLLGSMVLIFLFWSRRER